MDLLQFEGGQIEGWLTSANHNIGLYNNHSMEIAFEAHVGTFASYYNGRVWFRPDATNGAPFQTEFQGVVAEVRIEQQLRNDFMYNGVNSFNAPMPISMIIRLRINEINLGDRFGFLPNFIDTNYETNNIYYSGLSELKYEAIGNNGKILPIENIFEPEYNNRLKQIDDFDIITNTEKPMDNHSLFNYLNLDEVGSTLADESEPGHDNITDLVEVAGKMPRTPEEIEDFAAPFIASVSLNALYRCNELKARASVYAGNKKVDLDAEYGRLIENSDKAATITKEISKSRPSYIRAAKESEKAKAYVEFYNGLSANFEKCHYWAKSREVSNNQEFKGSAYEPHHAADSVKGDEETKQQRVHSDSEKGQKNKVTPVEDVNF